MPKKNSSTATPAQTIVVDVSADDYKADLAKGLQEDETLQPGRYIFRRGGFLQRHGDAALTAQPPMPTKVRISINIDADILDYFRARAAQPNAAPYQTQINHVLRTIMEQEQQHAESTLISYADALVADQRFIDAVARRVAEQSVSYATEK